MINSRNILKKITDYTKLRRIKWSLEIKKNYYSVYQAELKLTENKGIHLELVKKTLENGVINIYMDINLFYFTLEQRKLIKTFYLSSYKNLIEIYSLIKFSNILNNKIGKEKYIDLLYTWTKNDLINWNKGKHCFILYDTKTPDMKVYFKMYRYSISIICEYENKVVNINFISIIANDSLYDLVKEKSK